MKLLYIFIKEMILGRNSLSYAIKKNRIRVIFFILVVTSFQVNWIAVPRLITLSREYIAIEKNFKQLQELAQTNQKNLEALNVDRNELYKLRARVKELEETKACELTQEHKEYHEKYDLNYVKSRLQSENETK